MSSIVYLRNKKNNTVYAYLNESTWDPEKKKCICKRKCIGHVDPRTGEIVSNRQQKQQEFAAVRSNSLCKMFDSISERIGLTETLSRAFQINWKIILSIAYYIAATGDELTFCKQWSDANETPCKKVISADMISTMLGSIAAYHISNFFSLWIEKNGCTEAYTGTMLFESYEKLADYAETLDISIDRENYGTRMELFFSAGNSIPICYTLTNMNMGRNLDNYGIKHKDFKKLTTVLDEEKEDRFDIDLLADPKEHVTVRIKPDSLMAERAVNRVRDSILNPENYRIICGTPLFVASHMNYLKGRKYYTHVCFDPNRAVSELSSFIAIVNGCMHELKSGQIKQEHKPIYDKYLIYSDNEDSLIVEHNGENIIHHDENTGFSVVLSNVSRDPGVALNPFFEDKLICEVFRKVVNDYDNTALNLFSESYLQTRIFVQFIALIIRTEAERVMSSEGLNKTMTYKEMVDEISNIRYVSVPGTRKKYVTATNPLQKRILRAFDIDA